MFGYREHSSYCASLPFVEPKSRELGLDVISGKVSVGGDGSRPVQFTSRLDVARYLFYVLTHLPVDQLNNSSFNIAGDTKVRAGSVSSLDGNRNTKLVVQRDIQGIRSENREESGSDLRPHFGT